MSDSMRGFFPRRDRLRPDEPTAPSTRTQSGAGDPIFAGAGEIRALCRAIDWGATPLGPPDSWPPSLRLAVRMCLDARFPMTVWAGPEHVLIYNDGYPPVLGPARHPGALGRRAREVWAEIWDRLEPELEQVLRGESTVHEDERFLLRRGDASEEERFFTYSFTPIQEPDGAIVGALNVFVETTERVRSLGEHQARYRAVFESASDAILVTDPTAGGRILSANPAACRLFGYSEAEFREVDRAALFDAADSSLASMLAARGECGEAAAVLTCRRKDGSHFTGELRSTSFVNVRGLRQAVSILRDVTERQRADAALRQALAEAEEGRRTLRALMDSVPEGITIADAEGVTIRMVSRYGQDLLGGSHNAPIDEVVRRWEVFRPDGRTPMPAEELPLVRAVKRGETVHDAELVQASAAGERLTLLCNAAPIRDADGAIRGGVVAWKDITERKQAEEALRASEERYRTLFESMDEGFCVIEVLFEGDVAVDYRFLELNPAFEQHTGLRDAVGRRIRELAPDLEEHWFEIYGRVARTGEPIRFQNEARELGRFFDVHASRVGRPEQRRVAILFSDITERRRAELALEEANAQLRDADRRKDEFLGVLSHELRNPLTPIKNSLFILDRAPPGSEQARRAQEVAFRQVDQLARLVDDLLDVTRITRGKIQLQPARVDLGDLVSRTVEDYRATFDKVRVRVQLDPSPSPVFVRGDASRLAQVLGNLLQNAAKFTPPGGRVEVSVRAELAAARGVVRVADTGIGMSPEMVGRLFEPFMQADTTLDRSKGGLGLGLALVKGLVELHGGDVSAASAGPDRGTEFTVRLPLDFSTPAVAEGGRAAPRLASRRVLIIEDNLDAADSLREVLEMEGHEVAVAHDGNEGISRARRFRPEIVLCDIGLPGMDGYAVARAIRGDEALRGTKLVALSGYANPEDLRRAAAAGFERHLAKPPSLDRLSELLDAGASAG